MEIKDRYGKPNYVLSIDEAVLRPVENTTAFKIMRVIVLTPIVLLILLSIIVEDNIFADLPRGHVVLWVIIVWYLLKHKNKEWSPSPMELLFFDDRLILYLPKRYYSKSVTRMELHELKYSDITKCMYKEKSQRIHIYGSGVATWWNYKADGTPVKTATRVNEYKDGLVYFNTRLANGVDFKKEIEGHSPIKLVIENS